MRFDCLGGILASPGPPPPKGPAPYIKSGPEESGDDRHLPSNFPANPRLGRSRRRHTSPRDMAHRGRPRHPLVKVTTEEITGSPGHEGGDFYALVPRVLSNYVEVISLSNFHDGAFSLRAIYEEGDSRGAIFLANPRRWRVGYGA